MTTESGATSIDDLKATAHEGDQLVGVSVGSKFGSKNYSDANLIAATKVTNTSVYNADGDKLGWLDEVVIDKRTGKVSYVVLAVGGFLGLGERYVALDWDRLVYDEEKGGYNIDATGDQVRSMDTFDREGAPYVDETPAATIPAI
jgi:sporulation protein YlmC with PRC-barrel domain